MIDFDRVKAVEIVDRKLIHINILRLTTSADWTRLKNVISAHWYTFKNYTQAKLESWHRNRFKALDLQLLTNITNLSKKYNKKLRNDTINYINNTR